MRHLSFPRAMELLKTLTPTLVSLIVAGGGWIVTSKINRSQQEVSARKNQADVEIAQVNTAIRFVELLDRIPAGEAQRRARAIAVSVPILPPAFAFDLAVSDVSADAGALEALVARNKADAYRPARARAGSAPHSASGHRPWTQDAIPND